MKRIFSAMVVVLLAFAACRKDSDVTTVTTTPGPHEFVKTSIGGVVINEDGLPVAGANVKLGGNTATTDKNGVFNFRNVVADKYGAFVAVEATGYFHGSRTVICRAATQNTVRIQLLSNQATREFQSSTGGTADYQDYSITLPENAVRYENGGAYTGSVHVAAKWLDPTNQNICEQMPGRLQGITTSGDLTGMVSMGMLAVELTNDAGEKLQVADGKEATIRMKVPVSVQAKAPATIPLWYFDEQRGIWVEEGSATLDAGTYVGKVKHFTFWNCDYYGATVTLTVKVQDQYGNPIPNAQVFLNTTASAWPGYGIADNNGEMSGLVPQNEVFDAQVFLPIQGCSGPILQQQIGPFTADATVTLTVSPPTITTYTITGHLTDCAGNAVTNGYVKIDTISAVAWTDAQGNFSATITSCFAVNSVEIEGYDLTNLKESAQLTLNLTPGVNNVGTILVCDALSTYFTYTFNGNTHTYLNLEGYSLDTIPGGLIDYIQFYVPSDSSNAQYGFYIRLKDVTGVGTYNALVFHGEGTENTIPINHYCSNNCNISFQITEFGGVNSFIAGSYVGTIPDQLNGGSVDISGSFRCLLK